MLKSQGQVVEKAVIDQGKSEATAGLAFVSLSRTKRAVRIPFGGACAVRQACNGWREPTQTFRVEEEVPCKCALKSLAAGIRLLILATRHTTYQKSNAHHVLAIPTHTSDGLDSNTVRANEYRQ